LQPLQFPALVLFGVVVGWLVRRYDRLGPAVWAHVGFNVTAAVVLVWNLG
jgi:membrane protease YdiL (CAAX protease family)